MSEWIKVVNRLPEKEFNFLGTDGEIVFAAYWNEDIENYEIGGWETCYFCGGKSKVSFFEESYNIKKITHWMPLPNLPKEIKDE